MRKLFANFSGLTALISLLGGCVSAPAPADWIGATFAELQTGFGKPEAVVINQRNNRVYVFREIPRTDNAPTTLTYGQGEVVLKDAQCAITFEFEQELVSRWGWYEEGCRNYPLPARQLSTPEP
ncbi:MAG: hypothetical protein AB8B93_16310 [Pseudomonadales bacterium]